jgi:ligand-binding sensor domain-containing protein
MMKTIKTSLCIFLIGFVADLSAQNDIPVGTWRTHLSYNNVIDIALGEDKVYGATSNALFILDESDQHIQTITKLDGLSAGGISAIGYNEQNETLIVGYQDGNIDIIQDNTISSISTIKSDNFTTEKRINSIYTAETKAYLAGDFGVSIVDLQELKLLETIVNLGPSRILEVTTYNDSIFAATTQGVMATSLDPSVNILDFNNWTTFSNPSSELVSILNKEGQLYCAERQGSIYRYDQGTWAEQPILQGATINKLSPAQEGVFAITSEGVWHFNGSTLTSIENLITTANDIAQNELGLIWVADQTNGLLKSPDNNSVERIIPSGPFSDKSYRTAFLNNQIHVVSGGISENDVPLNNAEGFYSYAEGTWKSFNNLSAGANLIDAKDLSDMAYNPVTNQYLYASFQDGILVRNEDGSLTKVDQFTSGSSLLSNAVSSVAYGNDGLWMINYGQLPSVHHWSNDNIWQSFTLNNSATRFPLALIIAQNNDKWLRLSPTNGGGLFVFNEQTGKQRFLTQSGNNGGLPASSVYALAEDHDGLIWVGTSKGVAYFSSSGGITDNNAVNAIKPLIDRTPLLRDEKITAIAVDPGNRKWIGSENGVWLFDENGEREILHFNINNSPLLSNTILSISIDSHSGEVFFATGQGMISYRSTATSAEATHQSVKIFPNPITREFNGTVAISGLVNSAIVKITDVSGKLIRQMQANGGTASWNVADYNGNRASTGVYLVFSSSEDGTESFVGKIAVVN